MAIIDDTLAMKTAKQHVKSYTDEQEKLMREHYDAMDCLDCEAFLQLGIDAFDWLSRAYKQAQKQFRAGKLEPTATIREAFDVLYHAWLQSVGFATQWAELQKSRGFRLGNWSDFQIAVATVDRIGAESDKMAELAKMASLVNIETIATPPPAEWSSEPSWQE